MNTGLVTNKYGSISAVTYLTHLIVFVYGDILALCKEGATISPVSLFLKLRKGHLKFLM
jgi:hypothetical protein